MIGSAIYGVLGVRKCEGSGPRLPLLLAKSTEPKGIEFPKLRCWTRQLEADSWSGAGPLGFRREVAGEVDSYQQLGKGASLYETLDEGSPHNHVLYQDFIWTLERGPLFGNEYDDMIRMQRRLEREWQEVKHAAQQ